MTMQFLRVCKTRKFVFENLFEKNESLFKGFLDWVYTHSTKIGFLEDEHKWLMTEAENYLGVDYVG